MTGRIDPALMSEITDPDEALLNSQLQRVSYSSTNLEHTLWIVFAVFIATQAMLAASLATIVRTASVPAAPALVLSGTGAGVAVLWWVLLLSCFRTLARHDALLTHLETELSPPGAARGSQPLTPFTWNATHWRGRLGLAMAITVALALLAWILAAAWSVRALVAMP